MPQFALSPDGRTIVFVAGADGERPLLWRRSLDQLVAKALPGTEDAEDPFWSPDSRWIGFAAEGKLKKTPAAGGAVQVVVPTTRSIRGGTWGNDDAIVFSTGNDPLQRVAATGGKPTLIDKLMPGEVSRRFPVFLPDGRRYLYLSLGTAQNALFAGALDDTGAKLVTRMNNSAIYASPGYLVFAEGGSVRPAFRCGSFGNRWGAVCHSGACGPSTTFESAISVSDTGTIAYAGTLLQKGTLTWFDRTGQRVNSMAPEGSYSDFRVSPNGKLLAASMLDDKTGNIDIWMTDLARGARSRVTADGGFNSSPIWSPDSTQLLFRTFQKVVEFIRKAPPEAEANRQCCRTGPFRPPGFQQTTRLSTQTGRPTARTSFLPSKIRVPGRMCGCCLRQVIRRRSIPDIACGRNARQFFTGWSARRLHVE